MVQHVGPARLNIVTVPLNVGKLRQRKPLEGAFLAQNVGKLLLLGAGLGIAIQIDDIVEVARPSALAQRPEFFSEGFDVIVGEDARAAARETKEIKCASNSR
jgi:hypothetical protein